jgi:hypothetical protein
MRRLPKLIFLLFLVAISAALAFLAAPATARAAWVWPVSGDVITPYRNGTDPYASGQHRGIDIAAPIGTPVVAAAGGEVRFAGTAGSSGLTVSIRTGDGYDTSYLHLSSVAVRAGARVSGGERIGAVGISGIRSATAPHLHFGIRDAGTRHAYHDPLNFLPPPATAPRPSPPASAPAPAPRPVQPVAAPAPRVAPGPDTPPRPHAVPLQRPDAPPRPRAVPLQRPHAPPRPLPAPGRHPSPRSVTRPQPVPRAAPSPLGAQQKPHSFNAPRPSAPPHPSAALHPSAAPHPSPAASGAEYHTAARRSHTPAEPSSDRSGADSSNRGASPAAHPPSTHGSEHGSGVDIGWAAACAGLLLAAALLGLTEDRRRTTKHAKVGLLRTPRPLDGRR